jgi:hypothetical protein
MPTSAGGGVCERRWEGLRAAGPAGSRPSGFCYFCRHTHRSSGRGSWRAPTAGTRSIGRPCRRTTNSQLSSPGSGGADAESSAEHDLHAGLGARWTPAPNDTGVMPVICRPITVGASHGFHNSVRDGIPRESVARNALGRSCVRAWLVRERRAWPARFRPRCAQCACAWTPAFPPAWHPGVGGANLAGACQPAFARLPNTHRIIPMPRRDGHE